MLRRACLYCVASSIVSAFGLSSTWQSASFTTSFALVFIQALLLFLFVTQSAYSVLLRVIERRL